MLISKKFIFGIITLFALFALFFAAAAPVMAFELNYPSIPFGGNKFDADYYLPDFIRYIFVLILVSAGGIGVISLAINGFRWMFGGFSPAQKEESKKRIFDSVLGIILLLCSVVLLGTINSELLNIESKSQDLPNGMYIAIKVPTDKNHPHGLDYKLVPPTGISDLNKSELQGSKSFLYYCETPLLAPKILVTLYAEKNFKVTGSEETIIMNCGRFEIPPDKNSLSWSYLSQGVYFYASNNCSGAPLCSGGDCSSMRNSGSIPMPSSNKKIYPKSFHIVRGNGSNEKWGVILEDKGGQCSQFYLNNGNDSYNKNHQTSCQNATSDGRIICCSIDTLSNGRDFSANYAYIFKPWLYTYSPDDEVFGVDLRSQSYGAFFSAFDIGDFYHAKPEMIDKNLKSVDELLLPENGGYNITERTSADNNECKEGDPNKPCITEISSDDPYYFVFYAESYPCEGDRCNKKCRVITNSTRDLRKNAQFFLGSTFNLYDMYIIPYGGD